MANFFSKETGNSTKKLSPFLIILIVCIAAFIGGFFATRLLQMRPQSITESEVPVKETVPAVQEPEELTESRVPPVKETDGNTIQVNWINPEQQPSRVPDEVLSRAVCFNEPTVCENSSNSYASAVELGTVARGVYDGRSLEMTTIENQGMGINYASYYVLRDPSGVAAPVLLDRLYRNVGGWFPSGLGGMTVQESLGDKVAELSGYVIDTESVIPELETVEQTVGDTQGRSFVFTGLWLRLYSQEAISLASATRTAQLSDGRVLSLYEPKEDVDGNVLPGQTSMGRDQFYVLDEDGRVLFYDLEVPFFKDDVKDENGNILEGRRIPRIRWNDGSTNTQEYFKGELGGCGFKTTTHVVSQAEIDQIGLTGVGLGLGDDGSQTQVFEPSSYENDYYTDAFNIVTYPGEEAKTLADFVHPYFYFQDAFDRWIEATSIEIIPPVECGKPVIYLYPEQVTDMTVWVNPKGGFSYTEPLYKNGWRITASPDGKIVNQDDGLEYPYLFWEGRGGMYSAPEHYWVVKQTEVETFLTQILDEMGFFENERNDFLEFWLPRMQEAPYYKIGFHGTEVMNQLAPLQLSVKPDHIFRILMDYSPLEHWLPSDPPTTLPHANREGFDVMEWGGVLR